jgi:hypothetical protein
VVSHYDRARSFSALTLVLPPGIRRSCLQPDFLLPFGLMLRWVIHYTGVSMTDYTKMWSGLSLDLKAQKNVGQLKARIEALIERIQGR